MPFLTLEDPNAKIKGSRDPLGLVPIWTHFARYVVTNLTTPSNSIRGYTTLLLGRYFCERLVEEGLAETEDALPIVLRCEQLGAYARHVGHQVEGDIRGIERVRRFIQEEKGRVFVHADKRGFILADQKVYGLWGLYSVPARTSGLIKEGPLGVTDTARVFIEKNYLPYLEDDLKSLSQILQKGGRLDVRERNQPKYFKILQKILSEKYTPNELEFYGRFIRDAELVKTSSTNHQKEFSELLYKHTQLNSRVNRHEIVSMIKAAKKSNQTLATRLEKIIILESLFVPAEALFNYLLMSQGKRINELVSQLETRWGTQVPNIDYDGLHSLVPEITNSVNAQISNAINKCCLGLAKGDYKMALNALLAWNKEAMLGRKAGPWVRVNERGFVEVRYRGTDQLLPEREALPNLWRNSYFIDSLKHVSLQLRNTA